MHITMSKRLLSSLLALLLLALCSVSLAEAQPEARILTLNDLQAMNDGNLVYATNDSGYITFLRGKYYDGVISNADDVIRALDGVSALLGADETTGFVKGNCITDDQSYRYFTLYQWQSESPVEHAIVKVIVDPEGQCVALSSSLASGVAANVEDMISPEQALTVAKDYLTTQEPDTKYTYYEDAVTKTRTQRVDPTGGYILTLVYVVYTDNPGVTQADNALPYLAHYVSAMGEYLYSLPVSSIGDEYAMKGNDVDRTFEGKTAAEYSGSVVGQSGATHEITVPVMLDESTGTYYLADIARKIAVADYWEYNYNNENVALLSSKDNADWDADALLAYENYILAYDFYNAVGWQSADGLGTPMLLLANFVDEEHNPVPNASYSGLNGGWQVFNATSAAMNVAEALDVVGHEFTNCETNSSAAPILYANACGAINESVSEIMGNLIEKCSGRTEDTQWLLGETSGSTMRNMSDPHSMTQPESIGDIYYVPNATIPSGVNDRGGVHVNNMLLAGIAPKLYESGMTLEEERLLWTTFICALTPRTGYKEAALMLPFAADIAGLSSHQAIISKALDEIGANNTGFPDAPSDGRAMVKLQVPDTLDVNAVRLGLLDEESHRCLGYPAAGTDEITIYVPAGNYVAQLFLFDSQTYSQKIAMYYFDGTVWTTDEDAQAALELQSKETRVLTCDGIVAPDAAD